MIVFLIAALSLIAVLSVVFIVVVVKLIHTSNIILNANQELSKQIQNVHLKIKENEERLWSFCSDDVHEVLKIMSERQISQLKCFLIILNKVNNILIERK